jgi:hypothetical protein
MTLRNFQLLMETTKEAIHPHWVNVKSPSPKALSLRLTLMIGGVSSRG